MYVGVIKWSLVISVTWSGVEMCLMPAAANYIDVRPSVYPSCAMSSYMLPGR